MNFLKINKFIYSFSLLTWIANICFVILYFFLDFSAIWILIIFISNFLQVLFFIKNTDCNENEIKPHALIDHLLNISKYISICVTAICFVSLLVVQGGPEVVNGIYCIVDHGEVVRTVSKNWFFYFTLCKDFLFIFGILIFSSSITQEIRTLYLQKTYQ